MKKIILLVLISQFITLNIFDKSYSLKAVKAATGRSRFGDCLSIIYAANYIADKYNIPVLYQDFVESKNLTIQDTINELKKYDFKFKFKVIKIIDENQINLNEIEDVIYEVRIDFFTKKYYEITPIKDLREKFKKIIKPKNDISMPCIVDKNCINIAAHVRKGGGFDLPLLSKDGLSERKIVYPSFKPLDADILIEKYKKKFFSYADLRWPHKFPPDSFFVEQIKRISKFFPDKKIHVHIFTDDQNPSELMNKYFKAIKDSNISFSCREKNNHHAKNIIDDFFAMTKFDCLIRPSSTFSQIAEILGDFKIIISPKHCTWLEKDLLFVDKVNIVNNL